MKPGRIIAIHSFPNWLPQTQTWMYHQVKYLPEAVETHVVCDRTDNLDQFKVPNIHSLEDISKVRCFWEKGMRTLRMRDLITYLPSVSRKTGAQLIHSHFGHIGWIDMVAVEKSRARHIVTFYGADISKLPTQDRRWMNRYQELFERSDRFLCEGPYMAGQLIRIGCPTDKVTVHHLGVELEKTPFLPRRWQGGEPLRVLIAGAFREKKGIRYAIEALADLRQNVPLEITIIGDASPEAGSKSEKKRIIRTIDQTGMKSEIRLLGFQPYSVFIEEAYNHHVFISPSVTAEDGDTEGGAPVSIIEMIATGMPVVSTSHCDIPEVLKYGMKDWLVKERDVPGLVEKLRWLVEHPGEWPEILVTARRYVEEEFDAVQQGIKLAQIYKKVLS